MQFKEVDKLNIDIKEAVKKRVSTRSFEDKSLSEDDKNRLLEINNGLTNPFDVNVRVQYISKDSGADGVQLGTYGTIKGAKDYLAITVKDENIVINYKKEEEIRALTALDRVGILEKAYTRVDQLSGGQQQRVALARTLAQNPEIILADEPVAALDPVTAKAVMEDFQAINRDDKISILLNIHHVELALEYCERIIGIRDGEVVYDGPSDQVTPEILDVIYKGQSIE